MDLVCKQYFADKQMVDPNYHYTPIVMGGENPQCDSNSEVSAKVSLFMLSMNLTVGILSAITAPKLARLSDRHGRRRLMAIASIGGIISEAITIIAAKFPNSVDYRVLIVGSTFDGLAGSFTLGSILSQAYTSDCTVPSKRAVYIGYIHACLFTGLALGPLLAGYVVKWTGSLLSIFYIVLGCHVTFALFIGFVVPESLSARRQLLAHEKHRKEQEAHPERNGTWLSSLRSSNPLEPLHILWPRHNGTSKKLRINLVALAAMDTIIMGSMMAAGAVVMLYTKFMFHWENFELSIFVSTLSSVRVIILLGIFPVVNHFIRVRPAARRSRETGTPVSEKNAGADRLDIWVLRVAIISDMLGAVGYALVRTEPLFFASGMMTAIGGLGSATVQAALTKHVPPSRTGQILGAVGMLNALSRVIGPVIFNGLWALTVGSYPQASFVMMASLFALALLFSLAVKPHGKYL
jgi:MFS family permease